MWAVLCRFVHICAGLRIFEHICTDLCRVVWICGDVCIFCADSVQKQICLCIFVQIQAGSSRIQQIYIDLSRLLYICADLSRRMFNIQGYWEHPGMSNKIQEHSRIFKKLQWNSRIFSILVSTAQYSIVQCSAAQVGRSRSRSFSVRAPGWKVVVHKNSERRQAARSEKVVVHKKCAARPRPTPPVIEVVPSPQA